MISIDTITFGLLFRQNTLYNLDYSNRVFNQYYIKGKKYFNRNRYRLEGSYKICDKKLKDKNKDGKHYIFIDINLEKQEKYYLDNVWVTVHLNKFIYSSFNKYEVEKKVIFQTLYNLIAEIFNIDGIDDRKVTITEIHSCKDLFLKYDPQYYLEILKYLRFSRYYSYPNTGNRTITIHKKGDLKYFSFEKKKPDKLAEIYDKSRKFRGRGLDSNDLNILRFEYEMNGRHRRNIGIKRRQFSLSQIYEIPWSDHLQNYLFDKYLKDYTDVSYPELFGRQDESQEKKWGERFKSHPFEMYNFNEFQAEMEGEYDKFRYDINRYLDVFFKKSLKKEFKQINTNGLNLYNELYEKAYNHEDYNNKIPNVNQIYLN